MSKKFFTLTAAAALLFVRLAVAAPDDGTSDNYDYSDTCLEVCTTYDTDANSSYLTTQESCSTVACAVPTSALTVDTGGN